ncbi:MAG: FKBP-type peptidyl-prolyl cis-trans isomerase [Muribaculaceae bacterium]|nr:FKBP-type peptidyl-prolyl cis-trans isomerase [Muribaculaceae bacterium]
MNIKRYIIPSILSVAMAAGLSSCLGDDDDNSYDIAQWRNENETYFTRMQDTVFPDGSGRKVFESLSPVWAPTVSILAQWHNDRSQTAASLVPMDNSTIDMVYEGKYYNGTIFDASYNHSSDSIYSCKPIDMIVGVHAVLTNMHVGDSVTCVIPSDAGYGASSSSIMPYSTLIFNIKLKAIKAYEVSGK